MQKTLPALAGLLLLTTAFSPPTAQAADPLAHTYSIVARDPATGNLGVAVQSHWFQVGATVPWLESGVGAVATQSFVKIDYGPEGLALMKEGKTPQEALDALLKKDPQRDVRQVAMVDTQAMRLAWTGPKCIHAAGHHKGDGYVVQANLMEKDTVWGAMAKAYEAGLAAEDDLADRLLAALQAAEAEGGDIRGRQSAALIIFRADSTGKIWQDRLLTLRVDDHPEPLQELERLLNLHRAYEKMNAGDDAMAEGRIDEAVTLYTTAAGMAPDIAELPFWKAVTLFSAGHEKQALPIFKDVFAREKRWWELVPRLPASGLLPEDEEKIQLILSQGTASE